MVHHLLPPIPRSAIGWGDEEMEIGLILKEKIMKFYMYEYIVLGVIVTVAAIVFLYFTDCDAKPKKCGEHCKIECKTTETGLRVCTQTCTKICQ